MPYVNELTVWSFLQFKKNYQVNQQIHELETLMSETQNHIEKLSINLMSENNTNWLEIKHCLAFLILPFRNYQCLNG